MDADAFAGQLIKALTNAIDHLNSAFEKLEQAPAPLAAQVQAEIDMGIDGVREAMTLCWKLAEQQKG